VTDLQQHKKKLCSASAFFVITDAAGAGKDGRTVIASVHLPSNEVFGTL